MQSQKVEQVLSSTLSPREGDFFNQKLDQLIQALRHRFCAISEAVKGIVKIFGQLLRRFEPMTLRNFGLEGGAGHTDSILTAKLLAKLAARPWHFG